MKTQNKKSDELKRVIQEDINSADDTLSQIKAAADAAPGIEDRKQEMIVLRDIVNELPEEIVEEIAPILLVAHREFFPTISSRDT